MARGFTSLRFFLSHVLQMDVPAGHAGEEATNARYSHSHEDLRRWTAASTIQTHWHAMTIATQDVGGAGVAALRARHQLRKRAHKAVGTVELISTRLAALCSGVAEQARQHEAADVAWFEVRGAASMVIAEALPFIRWADKSAPPAELVRFLVPVTVPSSLGGKAIEVSLVPPIASMYNRSVPLQLAMALFVVPGGLVTAVLIFFDVCAARWLSLFVMLTWPAVLCYVASFNRVAPKRVVRTFQTIFVGVNMMVMFGALCFLWRNHPAKIAALTMLHPCFATAMFMDAYPELGRRAASLTLFTLKVVVVALLQAGITFNLMQLDDCSFEQIPGHPTTVTAIASGAIICIVTFGVKNICASLWNPGSLVVIKDPLRSLLLPPHALQLARTAHALLALHSAKHNATLKRQVTRSNSDRKSIMGSFQSRTRVSTFDSLPIRTPLPVIPMIAWAAPPNSEPRGEDVDETPRIGIVPQDGNRKPREDSDPKRGASGADRKQQAALRSVAAGLLRECENLKRAMRDLPPSGRVAIAGSLEVQIRDASNKAVEVVYEAIAIANSTHFSVDSAARSMCHVSSARPHEVRKEETLVRWFSAWMVKHRRRRFWLRVLSNLAWFLGASVSVATYFDAHDALWTVVLLVVAWPAILLNALAFNRTLLKGIATTFQTALVLGHATIMIGSLCALCRNQPAKLAGFVWSFPCFACSAFIDAYPAEGRAGTSCIFFTLNLSILVILQVGLVFGITRIDEFVLEMYGGWRFKASELAGGAINSLIPFGVQNLAASIQRPNTLAVSKSGVVCVYLDEHALRVLRAVHAFLMGDETSAATSCRAWFRAQVPDRP